MLVVEDEESYPEAMRPASRSRGTTSSWPPTGPRAWPASPSAFRTSSSLDVLLPGISGIEVCRRMRAIAPVPIVMVSAVDTELDVVLGLELGAADYVTKPFHLRELVARIQAVLRRVSPPGSAPEQPRRHASGPVRLPATRPAPRSGSARWWWTSPVAA